MDPVIQGKKTSLLFVASLVFACVAFSFAALGVSPPPDGAYPGATTAEGENALVSLTTGHFNTAVGWNSLEMATTAHFNTGVGAGTLLFNNADGNTAVGTGGLLFNRAGVGNTAVGVTALLFNLNGAGNTAVGARALLFNIGGSAPDGSLNTAVGTDVLIANTTGAGNTAVGGGTAEGPAGPAALGSNTTGSGNTAVGATFGLGPAALGSNTSGDGNTAVGGGSLIATATLGSNTTGEGNTAIGRSALNTNTTGSNNIALGDGAGNNLTTGDNNIDIGNQGMTDEANTIRIGTSGTQTDTYIAGISGATASDGAAVFVNANGKLGTLTSSARFKDEIEPMDQASKAILALKPVTFRYKSAIDPQRIPQFGLVAEEVEKVNPDLVVHDREGKPYTVRYEAVNAMLLNEFLKEHSRLEQQQATITDLKSTVAHQQRKIEALIAGLQKITAQIELSKPASQTVFNNL
jgi:hypothetical protein